MSIERRDVVSDPTTELMATVSAITCDPLPAELAKGASEVERSRLAGLGRVCGQLIHNEGLMGLTDAWPDELQRWLGDPLNEAVVINRPLNVETVTSVFPEAYTRIVSGRNRRALGTFFTPDWLVDESMELAASIGSESPDMVVDPGAGVGAYALRALGWWPKCTVLAVDVNVATLGLLATSWLLRARGNERLRMHRASYLDLDAESALRGSSSALVIGNPPYTRHQELDPETKRRAFESAGPLVTSRLAGLSVHFLAVSLLRLRRRDSLVLLMPANWLHCDYGRELRDHLWRSRRRVEIHTLSGDVNVFPDARVGAALVAVGPEPKRGASSIFFVDSDGSRSAFRSERKQPVADSWGYSHRTSKLKAEGKGRWRGESGVAVRRGVATGANTFFLLNDLQASQLPGRVLVPAISRIRDLQDDCLDLAAHSRLGKAGRKRWLFVATEADLADCRVNAFVARGAAAGIGSGVLCARRGAQSWFDLTTELVVAPILLSPMAKSRFRVVHNELGAVYTNSLYGITTENGEETAEMLDWLRSADGQDRLSAISRPLGSGLRKLEPRAVETLLNRR